MSKLVEYCPLSPQQHFLYDKLYKEIERKDRRNDTLSKSLKETRIRKEELEKEVNSLSVLFRKVNEDKQILDIELRRYKECERNQAIKSSNKTDSSMFSSSINIKKLEYSNQMKDREILRLEREIEELKGVKQFKEQSFSMLENGDKVVVIESLCEELGKKKSEAHGLALTLAEVQDNLVSTQSEFSRSKEMNESYGDQVRRLEAECQRLISLRNSSMAEMLTLHKKALADADINQRLTKQVEDLSNRLSTERAESFSSAQLLHQSVHAMRAELDEAIRDKEAAQNRLAELEPNYQNSLTLFKLSEEVISSERVMVKSLEAKLAERNSRLDDLEASIVSLHGQLDNAADNGNRLARVEQEIDARQKSWDDERDKHRRTIDSLVAEAEEARVQRDEGLAALRDTIDAVKDLSRNLCEETEKRQELEKKIEELQSELERTIRSKAQVTSAILDSLNKEKNKSSLLERSLAEAMPFDRSYGSVDSESNDASIDAEASVYSFQARVKEQNYSSARLNSKQKMNFKDHVIDELDSEVDPIPLVPGIGSITRSSAALQLQNLCFELRKIEEGLPTPLSASVDEDYPFEKFNTGSVYSSPEYEMHGTTREYFPNQHSYKYAQHVNECTDNDIEDDVEQVSMHPPLPSPYPEAYDTTLIVGLESGTGVTSSSATKRQLSLFEIVDADLYDSSVN